MTQKEISYHFWKRENWLSMTKTSNQPKYNKMLSFSTNKCESINLYISHVEKLKEKLINIYYDIGKEEWIKLIRKSKIYKQETNAYKFESYIFSFTEPLDEVFKIVLKMERVLSEYEGGNKCTQ